MQQIVKALAVSTILYASGAQAEMRKVHRREPVTEAITPEVITGVARSLNARATGGPEPYSYSLIGCVDEVQWPSRVLTHQVEWDKTSASSCINACFAAGPLDGPVPGHYIFASVLNGDQCFCDNAINIQATVVDQGRCNRHCENNPTEYCGGSREHSVYLFGDLGVNGFTVNPQNPGNFGLGLESFTWTGCWEDSHASRVLRGPSYSGPEMTPQFCAHYCWARGYTYSGVEFGNECYCDTERHALGDSVASAQCNQVCAYDSTLACGAPDRISIYRSINPPPRTPVQ